MSSEKSGGGVKWPMDDEWPDMLGTLAFFGGVFMNVYEVELAMIAVLDRLITDADKGSHQFREGANAFASLYLRQQYTYWCNVSSGLKWAQSLIKQGIVRKVLANGGTDIATSGPTQQGGTDNNLPPTKSRKDLAAGDGFTQQAIWPDL